MRNLSFAFLVVFGLAGVTGCGGDDKKIILPDLSMKPVVNHDLTAPLNGCNGLLMCLFGPNLDGTGGCPPDATDPSVFDMTCFNACLNGSTDQAQKLEFVAVYGCVGTAFCLSAPAGGGAAPCTTGDLDGSANPSNGCQACVNAASAALFNPDANPSAAMNTAYTNACDPAGQACIADKP